MYSSYSMPSAPGILGGRGYRIRLVIAEDDKGDGVRETMDSDECQRLVISEDLFESACEFALLAKTVTVYLGAFFARNGRCKKRAEAMMVVMMVMALAGVAVGLWRRHPAAWTVAAVYASLVVAHSIMFLTPRYPYVKLPLVIMGTGVALNTLGLSAVIGRDAYALTRPRCCGQFKLWAERISRSHSGAKR